MAARETKKVDDVEPDGVVNTDAPSSDLEIFKTIVDRMEQGVLVYDGKKVLAANAQLSRILDCPADLVDPGASLEEFISFGAKRGDYASSVGLTLQAMRMRIASGEDYIVERTLPDGRAVRIDVRNQARFGVGTYTDVTYAKKQSAILETTIDTMAQGLLVCDRSKIIIANNRLTELLGVSGELAAAGKSWHNLWRTQRCRDHRGNHEAFLSHVDEAFRAGENFTFELHSGEKTLWAECRQQHDMLFATFTDVTEARARERLLKESEIAVRKLADTDGLTGLANRRSFDEQLEAKLEAARDDSGARALALVLIDLDRFKSVNDIHGHGAGDALLQVLSKRFGALAQSNGTLFRIGGDEFAAIIEADAPSTVTGIAEQVCAAATQTVELDELRLNLGASVGVAFVTDELATPDDLQVAADLALYDAKECGRGTVQTYTPAMGEKAKMRSAVERDLAAAVRDGELVLHYEVQHDLKRNCVIGYEALMRWQHPRWGLVAPNEFISVAEETGSIVEMGRWALLQATKDMAAFDATSRVAVNVSPVQFVKSDLVADVQAALDQSGLAPHRLEIELTEDLLIEDTNNTSQMLTKLRDMGVGVVLDDFGSGYSSLAYLTRFPFSKLKIDQLFIERMVKDEASLALVRSILVLASSLKLTVTAEGVETEEQLQLLSQDRCDEVQGTLLGKPSPLSGLSHNCAA